MKKFLIISVMALFFINPLAQAQTANNTQSIASCNLNKSSIFMFRENLERFSANISFDQLANTLVANFNFNDYQEGVRLVNPKIKLNDQQNIYTFTGTYKGVNSLDQDATINASVKATYESNKLVSLELTQTAFLLYNHFYCTVE